MVVISGLADFGNAMPTPKKGHLISLFPRSTVPFSFSISTDQALVLLVVVIGSMGEVGAAGYLGFCIGSEFIRGNLKLKQQQRLILKGRARPLVELKPPQVLRCETKEEKPSTYTYRIATDIPLCEAPGASFDLYLEDKPRVFKAMFPHKRSQRLNEEEWRIRMLPIQLLFFTVWPQIDMRLRLRSKGKDYPPGVPPDISRVLELDIVRWELQGLENVLKPSHFSLGVRGTMYPARSEMETRLIGHLEMTISLILPPALVPEGVLQGLAESLLKNMKQKVNSSLLADYSKFKREKAERLA
ncbi:hypothetical protein SAY86_030484 [Trapa natans]|uniref:DUF1997 domain-containing protein n=1 Tax=Trapa natans TaxID=22666 RepID=A0AAN7MRX6_TRANT|nr:hypothetical protein SAY86_030484 [Trapa natans]